MANLEAFSMDDYSAIDASLTDTLIEMGAISVAEVLAKAYTGATPSSSSTNEVKYAIMMISKAILDFYIEHHGINPNTPRISEENISQYINIDMAVEMLKLAKQDNSQMRTLWFE